MNAMIFFTNGSPANSPATELTRSAKIPEPKKSWRYACRSRCSSSRFAPRRRSPTAEKTVITNVDVATEHHVVGEDYGIAHIAIVANVASNHQQTMFADA